MNTQSLMEPLFWIVAASLIWSMYYYISEAMEQHQSIGRPLVNITAAFYCLISAVYITGFLYAWASGWVLISKQPTDFLPAFFYEMLQDEDMRKLLAVMVCIFLGLKLKQWFLGWVEWINKMPSIPLITNRWKLITFVLGCIIATINQLANHHEDIKFISFFCSIVLSTVLVCGFILKKIFPYAWWKPKRKAIESAEAVT